MTDTQSGLQDPAASSGPHSVDAEARFLKSLSLVLKDNRDVLSRLPELIEQFLNKEPVNLDLAEARLTEENRGDDTERLAERKQSDLERKLESMEYDIHVKTKRIACLDQTIKDKTATLEALKSKVNASVSTKDRKSVESELKKKDKLLEESEKKAKCLEEECLKLQKELEKKEKETSETGKVQDEKCLKLLKELEKKEKEISETSKVQEERIAAVKESENKVKEISDKAQHLETQLLKKEDELQRMYGEYETALNSQKSRYDDMINELAAKDKAIQEYMQRLASVSEKRVKQDQRLVEDTLSSNRQSGLEKDFSAFFDEERIDACLKMQSMYQNQEDNFVCIYYPRLACIILETAYEQVNEAKEAAADVFQGLTKLWIEYAPRMGKLYSTAKKMQLQCWEVKLPVSTQIDGSECSKDVIDGMMLSLKEAAVNCNLDGLVESVSMIAYGKWEKWCDEDKSCLFTPAGHLMHGLVKYINACIRLTWRMVTQVPPMKLEFHSSRFSKDIHKIMGYHGSVERRARNSQPAHQDQGEEIAYYLWPGLQDGGGRLIRAGEIICKVEEPVRYTH